MTVDGECTRRKLDDASVPRESVLPPGDHAAAWESALLTHLGGLPPLDLEMQQSDAGVILRVDEMTLRVCSDDSTWRVQKRWRDADRGVVFEATDHADVARYVLALFGNEIRRARGLGRAGRTVLLSDDGGAQPDGGFALTQKSGDGYRLSRDRVGRRHPWCARSRDPLLAGFRPRGGIEGCRSERLPDGGDAHLCAATSSVSIKTC